MSTSTSPAPPSALGECVVCGKESSSRCSSCAKGGVDWMYFCSREHQKLIWSVHKRLCGKRFEWPALKPREVAEMIDLSTKPIHGEDGTSTWLELFEQNVILRRMVESQGGVPTNPIEMFNTVVMGLGEGVEVPGSRQDLLAHFRGLAFATRRGTFVAGNFSYDDLTRLIEADPLGFLADSQSQRVTILESCWNARWFSDLQHRFTILVASFISLHHSLLSSDTTRIQEGKLFLNHAVDCAVKYAEKTVRSFHPNLAKKIVDKYIPFVVTQVGMEMHLARD